jgi:hypothetical protein
MWRIFMNEVYSGIALDGREPVISFRWGMNNAP